MHGFTFYLMKLEMIQKKNYKLTDKVRSLIGYYARHDRIFVESALLSHEFRWVGQECRSHSDQLTIGDRAPRVAHLARLTKTK